MGRLVQAQTRKYKPESENYFESQIMPEKKTKVKLGLKNIAMLPFYFNYIFVHLRQKIRLRPDLNPKFLTTLCSKPEPDPKSQAQLTTL